MTRQLTVASIPVRIALAVERVAYQLWLWSRASRPSMSSVLESVTAMPHVFHVAAYFMTKADADAGDSITNLKMQKLVYYAQGFSLAVLDAPLFDEPMEAWTHGPVVPELYDELKRFGAGPLEPTELSHEAASHFSPEQCELLDDVYEVYGQFSAWKLRDMTHLETPWKETAQRAVITHDSLREYFLTQVQD